MNTDSQPLKPHRDSKESKRNQVEKMFDDISGNYDFLNQMISFGMDKRWKKKVLQLVRQKKPEKVLDIATGTGDMAIMLSDTGASEILGIDISRKMLDVADRKIAAKELRARVKTELQDCEDLTIDDNTFDAATVLYGLRNFEHLQKGLSEIFRILKQQGIFVILETSVPENKWVKSGYLFYTKHVMPAMAKIFSKDKQAYQYLSDSAIHFPYGTEMKTILEGVGFREVKIYPQFFGVATVYCAKK